MFPDKAPFGVPNLYSQSLKSEIKKIITSKSYLVKPDDFRKILNHNKSRRDAFRIVSALLMAIDEYGSYSLPVLKALHILLVGLKEDTNNFVEAAASMTLEIRAIMFLSFREEKDPYREQVHALAQTIYEFLAYKVSLPDNHAEATQQHRARYKPTHSISRSGKPPLPENRIPIEQPQQVPQNYNIKNENDEEEDEELPFDLRKINKNKSWRNSFNPFSSQNNPFGFGVQPEPEKEEVQPGSLLDSFVKSNPGEENLVNLSPEIPPPQPVEEDVNEEKKEEEQQNQEPEIEQPKPEGIYNPRDVVIINEYQLIKKTQYDDSIESY